MHRGWIRNPHRDDWEEGGVGMPWPVSAESSSPCLMLSWRPCLLSPLIVSGASVSASRLWLPEFPSSLTLLFLPPCFILCTVYHFSLYLPGQLLLILHDDSEVTTHVKPSFLPQTCLGFFTSEVPEHPECTSFGALITFALLRLLACVSPGPISGFPSLGNCPIYHYIFTSSTVPDLQLALMHIYWINNSINLITWNFWWQEKSPWMNRFLSKRKHVLYLWRRISQQIQWK